MDLTSQSAMNDADVLFRGKDVTLSDSHRWILAGRHHKEHHWLGLLGNGAEMAYLKEALVSLLASMKLLIWKLRAKNCMSNRQRLRIGIQVKVFIGCL
jgi:hypothetical protein